MKLSKSKLALAKVINENGGWIDGTMQLAASNKNGSVYLWSNTPRRIRHVWDFGGRFTALRGDWRKLPNWHQTILSREEYYRAYPMTDDDGWIEWCGGECPVYGDDEVDVVLVDGSTEHGIADEFDWHRDSGHLSVASYRLHKPDVKPEFCESVMRSIPDPEEKPTIEKLAQDYRNARGHADRLQKEADDAKAASDAALGELELAGEALGLLIGIAKSDQEPELVITNWRDLEVGDLVEVVSSLSGNREGEAGTVTRFDEFDKGREVRVHFNDNPCDYEWCVDWKFIRRP